MHTPSPASLLAPLLLVASGFHATARAAEVSPCPPDWEAQICELKSVVEVLKKEHLTEIDIPAFLDETIRLGVKTLPYAQFRSASELQEQTKREQRTRNGETGAPLKVTLLRGASQQRLEFTLVRALIKPRPVTAKLLDGNVLYTRLASFPEPAIGDYIDVVQAERKKNPAVKGMILDLRINGGGALNAAIGITALFTGRNKTAMVTLQRGDKIQQRFTTNWPDYILPDFLFLIF
ncbi:Peptidase family S41 [Collimonas sp. OK607]|nr:Peptidase family S41 [Collimonas sp. OK607]